MHRVHHRMTLRTNYVTAVSFIKFHTLLSLFTIECCCINVCTGSAATMRRALFYSELALTYLSEHLLDFGKKEAVSSYDLFGGNLNKRTYI